MGYLLAWIWLTFHLMFTQANPVDVPMNCPRGTRTNTAHCSFSNYKIPGFPTRDTWRREADTPTIFYGRAIRYSPGLMWSTAMQRGFEKEYLVQFDCLVSGFFINDVGRVAWMLHGGNEYRCLIVDNAKSRDLYETVILNREAVEVSFDFAAEELNTDIMSRDHDNPIVVMAYQIERPTSGEWFTAVRLDEYLLNKWESSYNKEPKGLIQVKSDQQVYYNIEGDSEWWFRVPGCLYCEDESKFDFTDGFDSYEVVYGDSLELISRKVYGYSHPRFWEKIYEANKDQMPNPYFISIGQILRIPVYNKIEETTH